MDFQGLQLKVNVSLGVPPEAEGNIDFLSSWSPHTSQGPETTFSQILIWMWALKVLTRNQIVNLRLLVSFGKKEQVPR